MVVDQAGRGRSERNVLQHMSGADFFGLVVTVLIIAYLLYALIRGENL